MKLIILLLVTIITWEVVTSQACTYTTWSAGINYSLGSIVKYQANGNYYKLVNVGTNGSDGTDPTISTWYWQPTSCTSTSGGSTGGSCNYPTWQAGINYSLGTIVLYSSNGNYYKLVNVGTNGSDGTDPTVSTWYWQPFSCSSSSTTGSSSTTTTGSTTGSSGSFVVSESQFNQMFPNKVSFYTYAGLVAALSSYPNFANEGGSTTAKQEAAAFLANVNQETGGLVYIREINTANWDSYCSPAGTCGGKQYYGRGPIQLSWNYNYAAAGTALGYDLLNNPDLVATNSQISWATALWYWNTQKGATSNTPHQAMVNLHAFGETIRAINGGIECNAAGVGHQEMLNRVNYYTQFCQILGVPTGSSLTC